jgi:hypothetical protein
MHARVSTLFGSPDQVEAGISDFRENVAPWIKEHGNCCPARIYKWQQPRNSVRSRPMLFAPAVLRLMPPWRPASVSAR